MSLEAQDKALQGYWLLDTGIFTAFTFAQNTIETIER
jgi:hypothetical protein